MIALLLGGLTLSFLSHLGILIGVLFLLGAVYYFTVELGIAVSSMEVIFLAISVVALPASFYIAGSVVESFVTDKFSFKLPLATIFFLTGLYLVIEEGLLLTQFESFLKIVTNSGEGNVPLFFLGVLSKAVMATTGILLLLLLSSLSFILPFAWLTRNSRLKMDWSLPSLNMILVLFFISSGYQLILSRLLS